MSNAAAGYHRSNARSRGGGQQCGAYGTYIHTVSSYCSSKTQPSIFFLSRNRVGKEGSAYTKGGEGSHMIPLIVNGTPWAGERGGEYGGCMYRGIVCVCALHMALTSITSVLVALLQNISREPRFQRAPGRAFLHKVCTRHSSHLSPLSVPSLLSPPPSCTLTLFGCSITPTPVRPIRCLP